MTWKFGRRWSLLWILVLLGSCAAMFETPDVRIARIRMASLGLTGGTAALDLEVQNPNDRALEILGVQYRLDLLTSEGDDRVSSTLGEGFHDERVTLGSHDTTRVTVEVPFEYRVVGRALRSLLEGSEVEYRLDGEVRIDGPVGEIRVPVERTGPFEGY